jgi:O-antigen ligase
MMDRIASSRWLERTLVFFVWAVPLTVAWTVAGVHIAIGIASAAAIALAIVSRRWPLERTTADHAMLALSLTYVVATVASPDRGASAFTLRKLLLFVVVYLTAAAGRTPERLRWCLRVWVGGIALTALAAMVHFAIGHAEVDARLRSTGHYMTFAGLLLFATPPCAVAAWRARGWCRLLYGAALAVLGGALLLSFTRGAWLGVAAAAAAMVARARPRWTIVVPLAAIALFAVLPQSYRARAISSFDPNHPMNADRLRLWQAGVAIWRAHPWTGVGLVDLKPYYLQYRQGTEGRVLGHLHDNWLQIAATTGTPGLLAFLWLMIAFGRIAWCRGALSADPEIAALQRGAWGTYCGFHVMGLFEWNFGDVEVTIALCYVVGAAVAAAHVAARHAPHALPSGSGEGVSS